MRIDTTLPPLYTFVPKNDGALPPVVPANSGRGITLSSPTFELAISPEAWAAYKRSAQQSGGVEAAGECETCKNRKYQDESDDSSVSFQAPARISPGQAFTRVLAHEKEHVAHEQANAQEAGRRILSQTVRINTAACPECGRIYVAGGVTRTVTAAEPKLPEEPRPSV